MSSYLSTVKEKVESAWNPWVDAGNRHIQSFKSFAQLKNNAVESAKTQSLVMTILNFPHVVLVDWPVSYCWDIIYDKICRKQGYESKKIQLAEKIFPDIQSLRMKCEEYETRITAFQNRVQTNYYLTYAIKYDPLFIPSSLNLVSQDLLICAKDIHAAILKLQQTQVSVNDFFNKTIAKADAVLQYDPNLDDTPQPTQLDPCDELFFGAEQTRKKVQFCITHVARAAVVIPSEIVQGEFNYAFNEVTKELRIKPISIAVDLTLKHGTPLAAKQVIKWYLLDLTGSVIVSGLKYSCIYIAGFQEEAVAQIPFIYLQHAIIWGTRAYLIKNTLRTWQEDRAKATDTYKYKVNDILTTNMDRFYALYNEKIVKPTSSFATTVAQSMPSIMNNVASWCSDIWNKVYDSR